MILSLLFPSLTDAQGSVFRVRPFVPAEVTFTCVFPVAREDGTPLSLSDIAGSRLYLGGGSLTADGSYIADDAYTMFDAGCGGTRTLNDLETGQYVGSMTVMDTMGRESVYSPEFYFCVYVRGSMSRTDFQAICPP